MKKEKIEHKKVDDLLLDLENPRLPEDKCNGQKDTLEYMIKEYDIEELVEVIGENGYFIGEPLIIIKSNEERKKYTVVEGNRRLSALKILNDPNLTSSKALKKLVNNAARKPQEIPCVEFKDRSKILSYLGLRHVKGVKSWSAIAKARYIRKIFDSTDKNISTDERVIRTSRTMGSGNRADYIRKNLQALYIYEFSKKENFFDLEVEETNFLFSVFMGAISKQSIKKEIGIPGGDFSLDFEGQIKVEKLKMIIKVICEKKEDGRSILGDPRELDSLAQIFYYPEAIKELEKTWNIKEALRKTDVAKRDFITNLNSAKLSLGDAQNNVQELRDINNPEEIKKSIKVIEKRLKSIKDELRTSHEIICDN